MWQMLGGLWVGTAISGALPIVNAEVLVLLASTTVPGFAIPLVALVAAAGQMSAKASLFSLARWAPTRLPRRARAGLARAATRVGARGGAVGSLVFASAVTGVPPFYGVSLAAGALRIRFGSFVLNGFTGRFIRFAVIAWAGNHFGEAAADLLRDRGITHLLLGG